MSEIYRCDRSDDHRVRSIETDGAKPLKSKDAAGGEEQMVKMTGFMLSKHKS
jgi:hypothetical protein